MFPVLVGGKQECFFTTLGRGFFFSRFSLCEYAKSFSFWDKKDKEEFHGLNFFYRSKAWDRV